MKLIPLTQGQFAIVDDDEFEYISRFNWHSIRSSARNVWYAARTGRSSSGKEVRIPIQREIMRLSIEDERVIDHKDGNGLNNQKCNLRICTVQDNARNRPSWGKSKYKGVTRRASTGKWIARICINYESVYIGIFAEEYDAALAYNLKAEEVFGEFARLNEVSQ